MSSFSSEDEPLELEDDDEDRDEPDEDEEEDEPDGDEGLEPDFAWSSSSEEEPE